MDGAFKTPSCFGYQNEEFLTYCFLLLNLLQEARVLKHKLS
jgi:hypothetical protein